MRFKVDENLPVQCIDQLRQAGHDAVSVYDQGLSDAPDPRIMEACTDEERVLVSLDLDFADIRSYPPSRTHGIVVFRLKTQDAATLRQVVHRLLDLLPRESPAGRLWVVERDKVRILE